MKIDLNNTNVECALCFTLAYGVILIVFGIHLITNSRKIKKQNSTMKPTTTAIKSGRAFNGFEKDRGTVVHLVEPLPIGCGGYWGGKAICGATPGSRGNGWHEVNTVVTCEKCIKKRLNKITI